MYNLFFWHTINHKESVIFWHYILVYVLTYIIHICIIHTHAYQRMFPSWSESWDHADHGFLKYGTPKNISLPLFMVITWDISLNSGTTPYPTAFHIPPKRNTYLVNHGNFNKKLDIPEPQTICKKYGVNRRYPLVNIQKTIEHCHRNSWFTHCHRNGGSFHSCYGTAYQRVALKSWILHPKQQQNGCPGWCASTSTTAGPEIRSWRSPRLDSGDRSSLWSWLT